MLLQGCGCRLQPLPPPLPLAPDPPLPLTLPCPLPHLPPPPPSNPAQGPSPDEVALVDAARQMGFEFRQRTQTGVTLCMLGEEVAYEILNVMEYTSDR